MPIELRKTLLHVETTFIEGGRGAAVPLRLIAALAGRIISSVTATRT